VICGEGQIQIRLRNLGSTGRRGAGRKKQGGSSRKRGGKVAGNVMGTVRVKESLFL